MRRNVLVKVFGMVVVLGAMVFWSCSQDEEIEEQMEWSKKAVKKSLADFGPSFQESYYFVTNFTFPRKTKEDEIIAKEDTVINAAYIVDLNITSDTTSYPTLYKYDAQFAFPGPFNPPLVNETVSASGSELNGYHHVIFKIRATYKGKYEDYTREYTSQTIIPFWVFRSDL